MKNLTMNQFLDYSVDLFLVVFAIFSHKIILVIAGANFLAIGLNDILIQAKGVVGLFAGVLACVKLIYDIKKRRKEK